MTTPASSATLGRRAERVETAVQVVILLVIGGMAGAASFRHVHDWTMANSPAGTGDWFGWANAVISELTPLAAGLEVRRRKRAGRPVAYPMAVLVAAATLSLSAQVAEAKHSPTGWLLAALPALAFLALSKLVLSRTAAKTYVADTPAQPDPTAHTAPDPTADTALDPTADTAPDPTADTAPEPAPIEPRPVAPEPVTPESIGSAPFEAEPVVPDPVEAVPQQLLTGARMAAFAHRQATGQAITVEALADHLSIPRDLAANLLHVLDDTGTPAGDASSAVTHVNGTRYAGSRA